MAEIAIILFDLNGVLYRYDRDRRVARLAAVSGQAPDEILRAIWGSGFEDEGDAGAFDEAMYLRRFGERMGYPLSEAEWLAAQRESITPVAAALAVLPRIRPGIGCAVLTNNNLLIRRHFAAIYPEVAARMAGRVCVSAAFGARKPDPEVYRRCLARLGGAPAATLFIDDSAANVAGARAAGLVAEHHPGPEGDLAAVLQRHDALSPAAG